MNNLSYDEKTQLLLKKTRITQSLKHEINFLNYVVKTDRTYLKQYTYYENEGFTFSSMFEETIIRSN